MDHEWHILWDDTKPASLYGGSWEELAQGIFLMSAGSGGTVAKQDINKATGGSTTHIHGRGTLVALFNTQDHDRMVRVNEETDLYGIDKTADYGDWYTIAQPGTWTYREATRVQGSTASASNLPPYITAHIWRRYE